MRNKLCGYVIDSVDYSDNDSIVTILSSDGLVSLRAKGRKKANSKMNALLYNYSYGEFEVYKSEKNGYLTLLDGSLLNYPSYVIESLDYMSIMGIVSEGINRCQDSTIAFEGFKNCLSLMEKKVDPKMILVAFINFMLEDNGVMYESDSCINCGNKHVIDFDFDKGGFLCSNCTSSKKDISYLKEIRIMTKTNFTNADKVNMNGSIVSSYCKHGFEELENKCGIFFKGKDFLFKILKMEG